MLKSCMITVPFIQYIGRSSIQYRTDLIMRTFQIRFARNGANIIVLNNFMTKVNLKMYY